VNGNNKVWLNSQNFGNLGGGLVSVSRGGDGGEIGFFGGSADPAADTVLCATGGGTQLRLAGGSGGIGFYPNTGLAAAFAGTRPAAAMTISSSGSVSMTGPAGVSGSFGNLFQFNTTAAGWSSTLSIGIDAGQNTLDGRVGTAFFNQVTPGLSFGNIVLCSLGGRVGIGTTGPDSLLTVNGAASKPGGGSWSTFSDRRLKTVGADFNRGLSQLMEIQPITYHYKADNALKLPSTDEHVGVIAQQVQGSIPEAVSTNSAGFLSVNNDPIIWAMLNAIKELNQKFSKVTAENAQLRAQNAELLKAGSENKALAQTVSNLEASFARLEKAMSKRGVIEAKATTENLQAASK
jgi:hypothetical protein